MIASSSSSSWARSSLNVVPGPTSVLLPAYAAAASFGGFDDDDDDEDGDLGLRPRPAENF